MSSSQFIYRKRIRNMSPSDLDNLRRAYSQMMAINDERGYNYLAGIHGLPLPVSCWHGQRRRAGVLLRLFLPWHRAYLYVFEQAARDIVPDCFIPWWAWWDWRSDASRSEGIPRAFAEDTVGGQPNPLAKARISTTTANRDTRREPDPPSELPTQEDIDRVLNLSDFGDFSDGLEEIHNGVHGWVSGDMGNILYAAYDPIFWSHHSMIDRIWWLWQLRHGIRNIPAEFLDEALPPFDFTVRQVLNVHDLGYDYAGTTVTVGENWG
jgi:tyrosinase